MHDYHQAVFHYSNRHKDYLRLMKGRRVELHEWLTSEMDEGYSFVSIIGQPATEETGAHVLVLTQAIPNEEQAIND